MSDIDQEYAEAALAAAELEREANVSAAVTWLRNVMEDDKPVLCRTIRRRARAVGIQDSSLFAARDKLGITSRLGRLALTERILPAGNRFKGFL